MEANTSYLYINVVILELLFAMKFHLKGVRYGYNRRIKKDQGGEKGF